MECVFGRSLVGRDIAKLVAKVCQYKYNQYRYILATNFAISCRGHYICPRARQSVINEWILICGICITIFFHRRRPLRQPETLSKEQDWLRRLRDDRGLIKWVDSLTPTGVHLELMWDQTSDWIIAAKKYIESSTVSHNSSKFFLCVHR